jgi:hypothetical protein
VHDEIIDIEEIGSLYLFDHGFGRSLPKILIRRSEIDQVGIVGNDMGIFPPSDPFPEFTRVRGGDLFSPPLVAVLRENLKRTAAEFLRALHRLMDTAGDR